MRYITRRGAICGALLLALFATAACDRFGGGGKANEAGVTATEYAFKIDAALKPGVNNISLKNAGKEEHNLYLIRVDQGKKLTDLASALAPGAPIPPWVSLSGGVGSAAAGKNAKLNTKLDAGHYVLLCFTTGTDGIPHFQKGMVSEIDLSGSAAGGKVPDGDAKAVGKDYAFELPPSVKAGDSTLRFENAGKEPHELIFVAIPQGFTFDQIKRALSAPPGPANPPPPLAGGAGPIAPGGAEAVSLSLAKGNYVVLCFVPDAKGVPHYNLGMLNQLKVE